jgi:hypothetical protein
VEIDDPDLTSLALSFKGHLAWMLDDPHGVIALSRAARRDSRVFIAQHAYNAHQEARGWAMAGESAEVDRPVDMPDDERDSEWAVIFIVAAAEALTTAGKAECAVAQSSQAVAVCRTTRSTRLARALQRAHAQMRDT